MIMKVQEIINDGTSNWSTLIHDELGKNTEVILKINGKQKVGMSYEAIMIANHIDINFTQSAA